MTVLSGCPGVRQAAKHHEIWTKRRAWPGFEPGTSCRKALSTPGVSRSRNHTTRPSGHFWLICGELICFMLLTFQMSDDTRKGRMWRCYSGSPSVAPHFHFWLDVTVDYPPFGIARRLYIVKCHLGQKTAHHLFSVRNGLHLNNSMPPVFLGSVNERNTMSTTRSLYLPPSCHSALPCSLCPSRVRTLIWLVQARVRI